MPELICNLHIHSKYSDGSGNYSQILQAAVGCGLDVVIITDHNTRETLGVCDTIYLLDRGRILEHGDPGTIASSELAREVYLGKKFRM